MRPAARLIVRSRLRSVTRLVKDVSAGCIRKPEYIHQLRVAIRRAEAAINAFEPELRPRAVIEARRRLRAVRKAAGAVRDCDVHGSLLSEVDRLKSDELRPVQKYLSRRLVRARRQAADEVITIASRKRVRKLKQARKALMDLPRRQAAAAVSTMPDGAAAPSTLLGAALRTFTRVSAETRGVAATDLGCLENLHALRVSAKQVRYAVEIFRTCIPDSLCEATLAQLREFQAVLGRVNDARQMSSWLADEARLLAGSARPRLVPKGSTPESIHEELRVIVGGLEADLAAAHQAALPHIPGRLDAALKPLEDWTLAALMLKPDADFEQTPDHRRVPAGRRAEGPADRPVHQHQSRRQAVPGA